MTDSDASPFDDAATTTRRSTGVPGLNSITDGGFLPGRNYMVRGEPGAGKTLLGMHFLTANDAEGESLFVNLGEAQRDIKRDARQFGFDLDELSFLDLSPSSEFFVEDRSYDVFPSEQVEGDSVTDRITSEVLSLEPNRVFVDPLTQFRYLSPDDYQFRRQVLSFLRFLKEQDCTVVFTSQDTPSTPDDDLQFMSDGVVHLGQADNRRTVQVSKFRGSDFQGGVHAAAIEDDGLHVFPRLLPENHHVPFSAEQLASGVPELDELLGGGLERGTVSIVSGPSGVGKTTLGTQFAKEAAGRGERSVIYLFEESAETFRHRLEAINVPVGDMLDRGSLELKEVEALTLSPEEFAFDVRREVENEGTDVVMVDGIDGYRMSLVGRDDELTQRLHALTRYLQNVGATTILTGEVQNVTGEFYATKDEVNYLADNIIFLRYLEFDGELRKAIGVLKKRASDFERSLREFEITNYGLKVGEPLSELRGILRGTPEWSETSGGPRVEE